MSIERHPLVLAAPSRPKEYDRSIGIGVAKELTLERVLELTSHDSRPCAPDFIVDESTELRTF